MKRDLTAVLLTMFFVLVGFMMPTTTVVSAALATDDESSVDMINEAADMNSDGRISVVDLVMANNQKLNGKVKLIRAYLTGRKIQIENLDLEKITINNPYQMYEKVLETNDWVVNISWEDEYFVVYTFNNAKTVFKCIKGTVDYTGTPFKEIKYKDTIIQLAKDSMGNVFWQLPKFDETKFYNLNKFEANSENISWLQSLLEYYDSLITCKTGKYVYAILSYEDGNVERTVILSSTNKGKHPEKEVFTSYNTERSIEFGIIDGKLTVQSFNSK